MESSKWIYTQKNSFSLKTVIKANEEIFNFTWSIENFSLITDKVLKGSNEILHRKKGIKSSQFTIESFMNRNDKKYFWQLVVWPHVIIAPSNDEYLALWLIKDDKLHESNYCQVKAVISLIDAQGEKAHSLDKECGGILGWSNDDWSKFLKLSRATLLQEKEKLLPNDILTIRCELHVKYKFTLGPSALKYPKSAISSTFSDLKALFEDKRNYDVSFCCDGIELKAHKLILSARSSVFAKMFENEMSESKTGIVDIQDVGISVLEKLLHFIYGIEIELPEDSCLVELYYLADKYDLVELKQMCSAALMDNLTTENLLEVASAADAVNDQELFSAAKCFFKMSAKISETFIDFAIMSPDLAKRLIK